MLLETSGSCVVPVAVTISATLAVVGNWWQLSCASCSYYLYPYCQLLETSPRLCCECGSYHLIHIGSCGKEQVAVVLCLLKLLSLSTLPDVENQWQLCFISGSYHISHIGSCWKPVAVVLCLWQLPSHPHWQLLETSGS
jgi:hypothetical protein